MQFHLNGFKPGDPDICDPVERLGAPGATGPAPGEVDVLIVGSGPTGLALAAQLSAFPQITTCIVEQNASRMLYGQADGIACRSVEMFNAFGFAERVLREACWVNETTFWKADPANPGHIIRSGRVQDTEDGLSEFPHVILNQARVHDFFLDVMHRSPTRLAPHYSRRMLDLSQNPSATHPVTVTLERTEPGHEGEVETIRARYVVGCDGARSAVRKSIGLNLHGDSANQAWGVMDILAVTDFPDVRMKALIQATGGGNIILIPREGDYLFRVYVEMDKLGEDERVASRNITAENIIAAAQKVFQPYTLEVKEVAWWSVYEIGQRLTDVFDDGGEGRLPHVFIAGNACHTHSAKAGQGMNVSMQDTFNLGWKLVGVLTGQYAPDFLSTYSAERQAIAKNLIDFDREWTGVLSAAAKSVAEGGGLDPAEVQRYFVQHGRYTAGTATRYTPSRLTGDGAHQPLARGFEIGTRFHSAPEIRPSDGKPVHLGHVVKADCRWRLFAFAGKGGAGQGSALEALCGFLGEGASSPIRRFTPEGADIDAVIELCAVLQQGFRDVVIGDLPPLLLPRKGRYGLIDYGKVFCSDQRGDDIFDMRGIDREKGALVIVRPDQYVADVLPLDGFDRLAAYFGGFMQQR